jgi:hypothetical protein
MGIKIMRFEEEVEDFAIIELSPALRENYLSFDVEAHTK